MSIRNNNCGAHFELCSICGQEAGEHVGASRIPIEIFSDDGDVVCPDCAHKNSTALSKLLDYFYELEFDSWDDCLRKAKKVKAVAAEVPGAHDVEE